MAICKTHLSDPLHYVVIHYGGKNDTQHLVKGNCKAAIGAPMHFNFIIGLAPADIEGILVQGG